MRVVGTARLSNRIVAIAQEEEEEKCNSKQSKGEKTEVKRETERWLEMESESLR